MREPYMDGGIRLRRKLPPEIPTKEKGSSRMRTVGGYVWRRAGG